VKQKQTEYECDLIVKCELEFRMFDVSVRELLHFIFTCGIVLP